VSKQYVYYVKSRMNKVILDAETIQPGPLGMAQKKKEVVKRYFDKLDMITPYAQQESPVANDVQVGGAHYKALDPQPWDVVHSWGMGFLDGNVVKYVSRADYKSNKLEDLRKARWYLDAAIKQEEVV
jgi:hypothetical protein